MDKIIGSYPQPNQLIYVIYPASDKDHGDVRCSSKPAQQLNPIDFRHSNVQNSKVERPTFKSAQRPKAVAI